MSTSNQEQALLRKFNAMLNGMNVQELRILNNLVVERIRMLQKAGTLMSMSQFRVGEKVSWTGSDGIIYTGIIIRLNHKTVSVKTDQEGHWTVSPHYLRKMH